MPVSLKPGMGGTWSMGVPRRRGAALIVTLALLSILSLLIVNYVSVMSLDRSSTAHYSESMKADQIAQGGVSLILADLRKEMLYDGSPDSTYPARPVYTNIVSGKLAPLRAGTNAAMPALIRVSGSAPVFPGAMVSTAVNATALSANGRSVSVDRWNTICLGKFASDAAAPSWILVTRDGPTNAAGLGFGAGGKTLNNGDVSNRNKAVGRFAYAIYDEGSLLDITIAGHPSTLSSADLQLIKGSLAEADLNVLGIDPDKLIAWRNAATRANYLAYVTNAALTGGFKEVASGDTTFVNRQELIQAAQNHVAGLTTNMLQHLGTFTRDRNAPSWGPTYNASDKGGSAAYPYKSNALQNGATNGLAPLVRYRPAGTATITSYQVDGTPYTYTVVAGDAVAQRRFPLDRISWLTPSGPKAGISTAAIQACFGLVWGVSGDGSGASVWKYCGPSGTAEKGAIETLAQVAAEPTPREPNFFELLQAGILSGSLGLQGLITGSTSLVGTAQKYPTLNVLRIGANLIDQYDGDSYPTVIEYMQIPPTPWQAVGIENLPYLTAFKPAADLTPNGAYPNYTLSGYYLFQLWNPHQNAAGVTGRPPIRIHVKGSVGMGSGYSTVATGLHIFGNPYPGLPGVTQAVDDVILLSAAAANGFADPAILKLADTVSGAASFGPLNGDPSVYGAYKIPFSLPINVARPVASLWKATADAAADAPTLTYYNYSRFDFGYDAAGNSKQFNISLEFQTPGGQWIGYQYMNGINDPTTWEITPGNALTEFGLKFGSYSSTLGTYPPSAAQMAALQVNAANPNPLTRTDWVNAILYAGSDPRSLRFGMWDNVRNVNVLPALSQAFYNPLWTPSEVSPYNAAGYGGSRSPSAGSLANLSSMPDIGGSFYFPAYLCRNNTPNSFPLSSYQDSDGVQRWGDQGYFTQNGTQGNPYLPTASARTFERPLVINRPFVSVAEMGYASRDYPWRSLDFATANSADGGLLDFFTVGRDMSRVVNGRINLNTQDPAALQAIISGTAIDPATPTAAIGNPAQIASDLVAYTAVASQRLINKSELADRFGPTLGAADFGSSDEMNVKTRREGMVRALAEVGQTRTWNLLIDIVGQTGHYSPAATALSQFLVEGERRYWVHVALDRITGEILDQQVEMVSQ